MKKFLVILFVLALSVPSFAAIAVVDNGDTKLSLYSSIRLLGLYQNVNTNGSAPQVGSNSDLIYSVQGNSRLGLDFAVGNFSTVAELKFSADNELAGVFRLLYSSYKFDNGLTVMVGRNYTTSETDLWYDNVFELDDGLHGYGTMGVGRQNMLRLSMFNVDLSFIALSNDSKSYFANGGSGKITGGNGTSNSVSKLGIADDIMPAVEIAYNLNFGGLTGKIFGFYSGITIEGTTKIGVEREWIQSASTGFVLQYDVVGITTVLSAFYALNGDYVGAVRWGSSQEAVPNNSSKFNKNGEWEGYNDTHTWGTALSVGYKIMESLDVIVGGGFQSMSATDNSGYADTGLLNSYSAYVALKYSINEYFSIVPTVGYYVSDVSDGDFTPTSGLIKTRATLIAGAQFRVGF